MMPSREELIEKLDLLCALKISREDISEWAFNNIVTAQPYDEQQIEWKVLKNLGSVDLPSIDRDYLYMESDFLAWKEELLNCK